MEGNKPTSLTTERRPSRKRTITTLYETDSYVAVDKPYDLRIDKQKNDDGDPNLQDLVRASLPPAVRTELRHCHQLDYATSGVMLYATSKKAAAAADVGSSRSAVTMHSRSASRASRSACIASATVHPQRDSRDQGL